MSSVYATPILYLNMGGEMLYILQQRLQTQRISPDRTVQVLNDVINAFVNPKQLEVIFSESPLMPMTSLRAILERVVLSSIMKLDDNSMNKLFDLMIMMVKYQLVTTTGPREVILSTLNHLDAVRDMVTDKTLNEHLDRAHKYIIDTYGNMSHKEIWNIRNDCLREIQHHNVRVTILLRLGMQNQDASFNRLIQRYDEKYQDRREVLENVKLIEYIDDEGVMGSLTIYGDRVTLLGRNVYVSPYGHPRSSKLNQNLQSTVASNKSIRQELETLATQLGKEEAVSTRPFSLHLINTSDPDIDMDAVNNANNKGQNYEVTAVDEEGNVKKKNKTADDYKNDLIQNIDSDFSENDNQPTRSEAMDLMNMLNVV